jgi:hypothetical protein
MTRRLALWAFAAVTVSCGPPSVRPTSYADPEISCPGGRTTWVLEIVDERVDREGSEKMVAAIRDGIQKSFPGCHWTAGPAAGGETIRIEVHRFASRLEYDREGTGSWESAADWTVRAVSAAGLTLTEFQANEELSRPNYRNYNNEKESLSEVYQRALERTVKGLRSVPANGAVRLPQGTPGPAAAADGPGPKGENSMPAGGLSGTGAPPRASGGLERKSQARETS